jgi:hypothetical protein
MVVATGLVPRARLRRDRSFVRTGGQPVWPDLESFAIVRHPIFDESRSPRFFQAGLAREME